MFYKVISTRENLQILHEDNHIIVINKRVGDIVQGDKTGDKPLSDVIKEYLKLKYNKPGDVFLGVVHRLDRPTTGIVIFAKTSKALSRLITSQKELELRIEKAGNEILKAIKAGATVVTDIKTHRTSKKGKQRDLLSKFMIDAGYRETKVGNGIWKPASEIKAEPKEETTQTSKPAETNPCVRPPPLLPPLLPPLIPMRRPT